MPDGHELPHRDMRNHDHDDPFDRAAEEQSELKSAQRNPYRPHSDRWYAWREGWMERKRWDEERDAARKRRQKL
jgi:hypothetical protein